MPVRDGGNDVLWAECCITTEEHFGVTRLEGLLIDTRHIPFAKFNAEVALNPGKGIVLTDRNKDLVGLEEHFFAGGHQAAFACVVVNDLYLIKGHAQ